LLLFTSCLEGVFSETRMQPVVCLFVRSRAKFRLVLNRHRTLLQVIVGQHKHPVSGLEGTTSGHILGELFRGQGALLITYPLASDLDHPLFERVPPPGS
jgi:hypothetical protein